MSLMRNNNINHYIDDMFNSNKVDQDWNEELLRFSPFGEPSIMIKNQSIINAIETIFGIAIHENTDLNKPLISLTEFSPFEFSTLMDDLKMEIYHNFDSSDILTMNFNDNISINKIMKLVN